MCGDESVAVVPLVSMSFQWAIKTVEVVQRLEISAASEGTVVDAHVVDGAVELLAGHC